MSAVAPITRQTVGKTFIVAISVLGASALAQLCAVAWLIVARLGAPPPAAAPRPTVAEMSGVAPTEALPDAELNTDPFDDAMTASVVTPPAPAPAATPPPAPPRPAPATFKAASADPTSQDRFNELVEQARTLRERGDTYAAVTKLREALVLDGKNALPIAELAVTYEKMGFAERAAEHWRRVLEMGEAAGVYYAAAEAKLRASQAQAMRQAAASIPPPEQAPQPAAANDGSVVNVGLTATTKLGLDTISSIPMADPAATDRFTLSIPLKAKARARIDVRDVVVQVQFYDAVDNKTLEKTTAQVNYRWGAPPADWSEGDLETLEVSYLLPKLRATDEERKYYGYIVSVYYKGALQDFRSLPERLAQQAPPPRILPDDFAP